MSNGKKITVLAFVFLYFSCNGYGLASAKDNEEGLILRAGSNV